MSGQSGQGRVNVQQAAARLGISPDTLRKRCARGKVPGAEKIEVAGVPQWFVPVSGLPPDDAGVSGQGRDGQMSPPASPPDMPDLAPVLGEIRDLLATLVQEQRATRAALERQALAVVPVMPAPVRTDRPWWQTWQVLFP
jgi:hypothetical protein